MYVFVYVCMYVCATLFSTIISLLLCYSQSGLKQKLSAFHKDLDWLERMDVTHDPTSTINDGDDDDNIDDEGTGKLKVVDINDDFKREMSL